MDGAVETFKVVVRLFVYNATIYNGMKIVHYTLFNHKDKQSVFISVDIWAKAG